MGFDAAGGGEEGVGEGDGVEAGAVDEVGRGYCGGFGGGVGGGGGRDFPAPGAGEGAGGGGRQGLDGFDAGVACEVAAVVEEGTFEVGHQGVGVYDAGGGGFEDAGFGADVWFTAGDLFAGEETSGDTDGFGEFVDFGHFRHLLGVLGHDPFPGVAVGDFLFLAEGVEERFPSEAETGF